MIIITRNGEYVEKEWTQAQFEATSLPIKGWTIYTGVWPIPVQPPTPEEIIASLTQAVQEHLDSVARIKNYDGILSACTYATSTNLTFQAEGQACVVWRDGCWAKCYEVMDDVNKGLRPIPTPQELIDLLPVEPW